MKNFLKLSLIPLIVACSSANGALITVTNFSDFPNANAISNDSGALLQDTFVGVGYFNTFSDATLQTLDPTAFASILAGGEFVQFATNINWLGAGIYDGAPSSGILAGSSFIGKGIYTLIGNAATLAASTELFIAKHAGTFAADNPNFTATASLDTSTGNGAVLWGNTGKFSTDWSGFGGGVEPNYSTLGASASIAPEPSRAILAGFGLMGLMFRRRRA